MSRNEKRAYLEQVRPRYRRATKQGKKLILDEFCLVYECHRKHAVRILAAGKPGRPRKSRVGRPARYDASGLEKVLTRIWKAAGYPCGKRLQAMLPLWLDADERRHGRYCDALRAQLQSISAATLDRLLAPVRKRLGHKGRSGTRPGSLLREQIPIRAETWNETLPGFVEADTVAHCGGSMDGSFVWSLTLTDIATGWTECRAVWNKGAQGVCSAIEDIEAELPFPLRGFDSDNGSEFLNHHLLRYFTEHPHKPSFTRSRPYHKNDNAHVEQKNWTHVRQLLGYGRIEQKQLVEDINALYRGPVRWMQNFFSPSAKLITKQRHGARIRKKHDRPKTPAQRLLEHPQVPEHVKDRLRQQLRQLDPFVLSSDIQDILRAISKRSSVT